MNKIFISFLIGLFLISSVSAFTLLPTVSEVNDNSDYYVGSKLISYNELWKEYPPLEIDNFLGLGGTLFNGAIVEHTNQCVDDCLSIIDTSITTDSVLVEDIRFYRVDDGSNREINITSYNLEVTDSNGITKPYKVGETLLAGEYTLKISGKKRIDIAVDWIITTQGKTLDEWGVWGTGAFIASPYELASSAGANVDKGGMRILTNVPIVVSKFEWAAPSDPTSAYILDSGKNVLYTATVSGKVATFSGANLSAGQTYYLATDSGGAGYNFAYDASGTFPQNNSYFNWTAGLDPNGGADVARPYIIKNVTLSASSITLNSPVERFNTTSSSVTFNASTVINGVGSLTNLSLWLNTSSTFELNDSVNLTGLINNTQWIKTLPEGNWLWNVQGCDTDNICAFTNANRTLTVDMTPPNITIVSPTQIVNYWIRNRNLTLNWTVTDSLTGTQFCNFQYAGSNNTVTCSANNASFNTTSINNRQVILYSNDSAGNEDSKSIDWNYTLFEQNNSWTRNTTMLSNEDFSINITWDNNAYSNIVGYLNYDSTQYLTIPTGSGANLVFAKTLQMPLVSGSTQSKYFNWTFVLTNNTGISTIVTETNLQTVGNITLDDCSSFTNLIVNFTMYDENNRTKIVPPTVNNTVNLYLQIGDNAQTSNINISYNKTGVNGVKVCSQNALNGMYRLDSSIQYYANGYVSEYYNIQNYSLTSSTAGLEIPLYDLDTSSSQEFKINFKNINYIAMKDVLIKIERQYLSLGTFLTVEIPKTDSQGNTLGHFNLNGNIYRLTIIKENRVLGTVENLQPVCNNIATGDCTINLIEYGSAGIPQNPKNYGGIIATSSFNNNSKIYQLTFSTENLTSTNISLNATYYAPYLNQSICFTSYSGASGVLTCNLISSPAGSVLIQVFNGPTQIYTEIVQISDGGVPDTIKYFVALLLMLSLAFMGVSSGGVALILFGMGILVASSLFFISTGGILGPASAIMWFVIAIVVLIFKAFSGKGGSSI